MKKLFSFFALSFLTISGVLAQPNQRVVTAAPIDPSVGGVSRLRVEYRFLGARL